MACNKPMLAHKAIPEGKEHLVILQPKAQYTQGNLLILLEEFDNPIPITLSFSDKHIKAKRVFQINSRGPSFVADEITRASRGFSKTSRDMADFLDNVPPHKAIPISLSGGLASGMTAWKMEDDVYIRTTLTILSPAYKEKQSLGDLHVYRLHAIPSVLVSNESGVSNVSLELGGIHGR